MRSAECVTPQGVVIPFPAEAAPKHPHGRGRIGPVSRAGRPTPAFLSHASLPSLIPNFLFFGCESSIDMSEGGQHERHSICSALFVLLEARGREEARVSTGARVRVSSCQCAPTDALLLPRQNRPLSFARSLRCTLFLFTTSSPKDQHAHRQPRTRIMPASLLPRLPTFAPVSPRGSEPARGCSNEHRRAARVSSGLCASAHRRICPSAHRRTCSSAAQGEARRCGELTTSQINDSWILDFRMDCQQATCSPRSRLAAGAGAGASPAGDLSVAASREDEMTGFGSGLDE
ncbi:hypothetical protein CALCODRAFT_47980 [Calocera cornea HHB12733]|uniref:Uncharacterized protein n=1 Tax=Calocera cornea HHB12733 TaxID=1353952 RepID=A0A165DTW5_9BASI|nr:hypothetical protein CALCODRAFT_47980 [Calocera cornea HHB12733]